MIDVYKVCFVLILIALIAFSYIKFRKKKYSAKIGEKH